MTTESENGQPDEGLWGREPESHAELWQRRTQATQGYNADALWLSVRQAQT